MWADTPTLFPAPCEHGLPFDIFSAVFFLLSRYEEYLPFTPDKHERFPAAQSILFQKGWLQRPLIDEWIFAFHRLLQQRKVDGNIGSFQFTPSYDIDIAFSYKHKGWKRTAGAAFKDLIQGRIPSVAHRLSVIAGKEKDPYDCFDWLRQLHEEHGLKPVYFILAAKNTTAFDKNNSLQQKAIQALIRRLSQQGRVGIHPSYFSNKGSVFSEEKNTLEDLIGQSITLSRQHYIRLKIPDTYRALIAQGITEDFSMGYGAHLGFRAGTGRSFFWYDLMNEASTHLRIHPFCFMDSTAHFEEKLPVEEARLKLRQMKAMLEQTRSQMITVFHNFSLGSDREWNGWKDLYASFLEEMTGVRWVG